MKPSDWERYNGAFFMLALHLCVWIPYSLLACLWADIAVILVPLIVGIVSIPLYFAFKSGASWQYTVTALIAHLVLSGLAFLLIHLLSDLIATMYGGWEMIGHYLVLIALLAIGSVLIVLDCLIGLVKRLMKGREF